MLAEVSARSEVTIIGLFDERMTDPIEEAEQRASPSATLRRPWLST
ncbi:hypothetical protein OOZ19_28705 [Saccharopolyspora sp. NFXS83]|nr:hypothetical protein [Saccharopolyspora sp. NFXS83]MCX2734243.1 hypothetical protein [Saccharopolyspora sp. NFXS83]